MEFGGVKRPVPLMTTCFILIFLMGIGLCPLGRKFYTNGACRMDYGAARAP
jgi:formate hydrogenlyase subunit 3/multisubunit Na+/H+ antiporter MnhD subunit